METWILSLDSKGTLVQLADLSSGIDYCQHDQNSKLISLKTDSTILVPHHAAFSEENQILSLRFDQDIVVDVRVEQNSKYINFEIASISDNSSVDAVIWGPYATTINQSIGETIGIVQNDEFSLGIQALNIKTLGGYPWNDHDHLPQLDIFRQSDYENMVREKDNPGVLYSVEAAKPTAYGSSLQAYARNRQKDRVIKNWNHDRYLAPAYDDGGIVGSKIALFGCPSDLSLQTIGEIEVAEGLPHPEINGEWIKTSPIINSSYLIMDFTESNIDQCLEYSKKSGFNYLYHGHPFEAWGHFPLIKEQFPNGIEGMKACVDKAEEQGIYIGTHTLTNFINTDDSYVSPVPDKRLAKVGSSTLTKNLSSTETNIEIESPGFFNQFRNNHLRSVQIGDELIRYGSISEEAPWILNDCQRGSFGTKASQHGVGDVILKLADHGYKVFLGDVSLNKEIAENIADFMNYTGVRMLDFDGLEGAHSTGLGNYGEALFAQQWFDRLNGNLTNHFLLGASRPGHYFWHIYSRMNWGEPWYAGFRESQTEYRLRNQKYFKRNLMPGMLGWFKMTASTTVEDIAWLMTRSAAYNAGFAFVSDLKTLKANGHTDEIFSILKVWETARLQGKFTKEIMERMLVLSTEFKLEKDDSDDLVLTEIYSHRFKHEKKTRQPGEPLYSTFSFENKSHEQTLSFIITAQDSDISNIVMDINSHKTVELPLTLKKGQTIKYTNQKTAIVYDSNWNVISTFPVDASLLKLSKGAQTITFDCSFSNGGDDSLAKIELVLHGLPETIK